SVNKNLPKGMVPCRKAAKDTIDHPRGIAVSSYQELFERAKEAAFATIGEPSGEPDLDPMFGVMDGAFHAVQDLLPDADQVDRAWLLEMMSEKPDLFDMDVEHGSLSKGVIDALRDIMLDEMEAELADRARDAGYDISSLPAP